MAAGCLSTSAFACTDDTQCIQDGILGTCEDIGFCSFPDPACSSDKRFGEHAGGGLGSQCVAPEDETGTDEDTDGGDADTVNPETDGTETGDDSTSTGTTDGTDGTDGADSIGADTDDTGETADPCEDYAQLTELVQGVPFAELTVFQEKCIAPESDLNICLGAASDWCVEYGNGCYAGGAGIIEANQATASVICFSNLAERFDTTTQSLLDNSNIAANKLTPIHRHAQAAANGWCKAMGWEHGIGPVALDLQMGTASVVCLPTELADSRTFQAAQMINEGCTSPVAPHSVGCSTALHNNCLALPDGYIGGYGPQGFNSSINVGLCFL